MGLALTFPEHLPRQKYQLLTNNCANACRAAAEDNNDLGLPLNLDPRPFKSFSNLKRYNESYNNPGASNKEATEWNKKMQQEIRLMPKE